jgi:hypothetical protein
MSISLDYFGDGLGTVSKNLEFFSTEPFRSASQFGAEGSIGVYGPGIIDVRWRQHMACFAAKHGLTIEGDFVECGVHTGLMSMAVCKFLDFDRTGRKFYLFDTYEGIPLEQLDPRERPLAESHNKTYYTSAYERAKRNFSPYQNAVLVQGLLPDTLDQVNIDKIAYLSMDLNQVYAEKVVIERLWDKLTPGAMVLLDDYAWRGHELQYNMWNAFAAARDRYIATLPTGQGLLVK